MTFRRLWIAVFLIGLSLTATTPALAWRASKLGVTMGDVTFGNEYVIQKPSATLFHEQNTAVADAEGLAISFPAAASGLTGAPAIAETSDVSVAGTDTGFFKANWCYTALTNPGGYDLTSDVSTWHPMKSAKPLGSGVDWPYMNDASLAGETMRFQPSISTTPDTEDANLSQSMMSPGNVSLGNVNRSADGSSAGNSPAKIKSGTTGRPDRDYKNMTVVDIRNMSGIEKLYRNANLKNTIPVSYKGTVDRPTRIDPLEHPLDIIKPANKPQVLNDSRKMTADGTRLKTLFWDL
jgi:hypothetical protein